MERRQRQRQSLAFPIEITQVGEEAVSRFETTRNISAGGGVSFCTPTTIAPGSIVRYRVTLSGGGTPVTIACRGRVIRCGASGDVTATTLFEIALSMDQYRFEAASETASVDDNSLRAYIATGSGR